MVEVFNLEANIKWNIKANIEANIKANIEANIKKYSAEYQIIFCHFRVINQIFIHVIGVTWHQSGIIIRL